MTAENPFGITVQSVFQKVDDHLANELIATWKKYGALPKEENGKERAAQVVIILRNKENNIIGISTAFPSYIEQLKCTLFAFRCMIAPEYRFPGLLTKITLETRNHLEKVYKQSHPECVGIITEIYNDKLSKNRREAVFTTSGFVFIGYSKNGYQIRVYYFKGAKI